MQSSKEYLLLGLILWSLCSVLLCLFSQPLFESLFYLIWILWLLLSFGLCLREIFSSSPSVLVCMCPLFWGGSLVDSINIENFKTCNLHVCSVVSNYLWLCQIPLPMDFSGNNTAVEKKKKKNIGVGCSFFLQGIFPTQGSSLHLLP